MVGVSYGPENMVYINHGQRRQCGADQRAGWGGAGLGAAGKVGRATHLS